MNFLLSILNASDRAVVSETNAQRVDRSLAFMLLPTLVDGVANTVVGAPATGDHVLGELWVDGLAAVFRCTVAGTPGTWQQIAPAFVAADPGAPPVNYLICKPASQWAQFYWDGAAWQAVWLTPP